MPIAHPYHDSFAGSPSSASEPFNPHMDDAKPQDVYLVVGGSGLLGRHIVERLRDRGDTVAVLDLVQRFDDTPFYSGDIAEEGLVLSVLKKACIVPRILRSRLTLSSYTQCGATCVIHTASPHATVAPPELHWKVNVDGTNAIISACLAAGVTKLVYTSSSGVVFTGSDVNGADETLPYPPNPMDIYMETKIIAEKAIIAANGKQGLLTTIIRPSGIFGYASPGSLCFIHHTIKYFDCYSPGDRQLMVNLYNVYERGRTGIQIGNNKNLTDWTYVTNVADAHILAADKLSPSIDPPVAGEIFYITNDEPWPFWDFMNGVWDRLDVVYPGKRVKKKPFVIPRTMGMIMAVISELIAWVLGKKPTFTRFNITFTCAARWYKIDKAKRVLGYRPQVRLVDGMDMLVDVRRLFFSSFWQPVEYLYC
jgi:sterol-4alpha-carboxylate 3-dehydrogenase (decarboxylating)